MGIASKVSWRAQLAWEKLQGRHPHLPWGVAWRGMTLRRPPVAAAEVLFLEEDDAAQMVRVRVGGHDYWYPANASREKLGGVYAEVFEANQDHFYESRFCLLRPGDVVLDAGACEGFFVRYALERGARVLAVEPWSAMADCLERTFAPEIARGEVHVARVLLGPEPGASELIVDLDFPFGAAVDSARQIRREVTETVPMTTIDALVAASPFGRVDFLKMDIEGAEALALAGASATLRQFHPRLSVTTYHHPDDWRRIARQVRGSAPDYRLWLKGMVCYETGGYRPVMLHGWSNAPLPRHRA
jgi:FkbM family methyltransferase